MVHLFSKSVKGEHPLVDNCTSYDMEFTFDKDLRERPINEEEMRKGVHHMIDHLESIEDPKTNARIHGEIGVYLRILGELDHSEHFLKTAINFYRQLEIKTSVFINQLRLAHTYQWQQKCEKANRLFNELIKRTITINNINLIKTFFFNIMGSASLKKASMKLPTPYSKLL